jgi:hypothetical protein
MEFQIFALVLLFIPIDFFFIYKIFHKTNISINKPKSMNIPTQSYMVIIFGDFHRKEQKMSNIIYALSPMADSKNIRFVYSESHLIVHFTSSMEFPELQRLVDLAIHSECDLYLFFNYNEKFAVKMQPEIFTHLFDWNKDSESVNLDLRDNSLSKMGFGPNNEDIKIMMMGIDFDPFAGLQETLFKKPKPKKVELPLDMDSILEKISKRGIDSLTKREKEFLKNISNNNEES